MAAARAAPKAARTIVSGPDRAVLYFVAAYTGLRASELASLTPEHVTLGGDTPEVLVAAGDAKSRRLEPVPLHPALVAFLRDWLPTRTPGARLWPGKWAEHRRQVKWLGRDAKRAGAVTLFWWPWWRKVKWLGRDATRSGPGWARG